MKKHKLAACHHNLVRRYLLWAYKSTKESFERIERKTTQLMVDEYILAHLSKKKADIPPHLRDYIAAKRQDELKLKFSGGKKEKFNPEYIYLKERLEAIESAIVHFLGVRELKRFEKFFEEEFARRILESREH